MMTRKAQKLRKKTFSCLMAKISLKKSLKRKMERCSFTMASEMEHLLSTGLAPDLASLQLLKRARGDFKTPSTEELRKYHLLYPALRKKELVFGIVCQEEMRKASVSKHSSGDSVTNFTEKLKKESTVPNVESLQQELDSLCSNDGESVLLRPQEFLVPSHQPARVTPKKRKRPRTRNKRKAANSSLDSIDRVITKRGKAFLSKEAESEKIALPEARRGRKRQLTAPDSSQTKEGPM